MSVEHVDDLKASSLRRRRFLGGAVVVGGLVAGLSEWGSRADAAELSDVAQAYQLVDAVSADLEAKGTSIADELRAAGYEDLADEVASSDVGSGGSDAVAQSASSTRSILRKAVAGIGASFLAAGYKLSAELALHGLNLTRTGTTYAPKNGSIAGRSSVVAAIRRSKKQSGSGSFTKAGGSVGYDLYYAIHLFNWSRSGSRIVITDVYDFKRGDYDGLQHNMVNVMAAAQRTHAIYTFNVRIAV